MLNFPSPHQQILVVQSFNALVSTPFHGKMNAICWSRKLKGNFAEIVNAVALEGNMCVLDEEDLLTLNLTEQGQLARNILINDLNLLKAHGASPVLNVIKNYDRDESNPFFPTDVYSFHVDHSPIPTDTILCTYYGKPSELVPNSQVQQKILIPEIRAELKRQYGGPEEGFETFLSENFFDLHYQAMPNATVTSLGLGHMWRLAIEHPEMQSLPCVHRAPIERQGQRRLLMIC